MNEGGFNLRLSMSIYGPFIGNLLASVDSNNTTFHNLESMH